MLMVFHNSNKKNPNKDMNVQSQMEKSLYPLRPPKSQEHERVKRIESYPLLHPKTREHMGKVLEVIEC